jgi:hypothetical protein
MKRLSRYIIIVLLFNGCIGAGTHGSIKAYNYAVSKYRLEKVVADVFANNPKSLRIDSLKDYYNNDSTYITFTLQSGEFVNRYTVRYCGGSEDWDTSTVSCISIAYAHNKDGEGGSEGNGGVKWYNFKLKKELTEPLEKELISKIDKELGMKHTEE